jgi:crotonobetainyl-CoA:carnitine CoA-transferase CaiB-like acyl-CoA transferase
MDENGHVNGALPEGCLDGVTIIDLTRHMSGPYASLVLGDFGADVIKVESMPDGDPSRTSGTNFISGIGTMFLTWNRNKRSICVDLRTPEGVAVVKRLAADADIVIENYRPGIADSIGLGSDELRAANPRLIYVSVNAFGSRGPWKSRPGTDPVVQAMSGVMSVTGEREGGPVLVGIPIADYSSAMTAVQAMLLALFARERTGKGQHVEVPMLGSLLFGLTTRVGPYFQTGENPTRWGSQHSQVVPYQAFQTADGWVVAGVWSDKDWRAFCRAIDRPELADDERYDNNVKRVALRDELGPLLQTYFVEQTSAYWNDRFTAEKVLFAPVNSFSEVLDHPQVQEMGFVAEVEHPTAGTLQQIAPVIHMSDTPGTIRMPPPLLGQHTREILEGRGWSAAEIDGLLAAGTVIEPSPAIHE